MSDSEPTEKQLDQWFQDADARAETPAPEDGAETPASETPAPEALPVGVSGTPETAQEDWKARAEQAEQRMRSWEGRLSAADRENKSLRQELEALKVRIPAPPSESPAEQLLARLPEEKREEAKELFDAFPVLGDLLHPAAPSTAPAADTPATAPDAPDLQAVVEHFATIAAAHPDWREVVSSADLNAWVESRPYRESLDYQRILNQGTATEVNRMLSAFKDARHKAAPVTDTQTVKREQQKQAALAVPHRRAPVSSGQPDPLDEDAAWADALAEEGWRPSLPRR